MKIDICIFWKTVEKIQILLKSDKINGYFTCMYMCTFMGISRSVLFKVRNISDKRYREKNIYFIFNNFYVEKRAVYEIMWKNIVNSDR
jgi:hypothetical protein